MMTQREIRIWLKEVESDKRIHYNSVNLVTNAPLALEQISLDTTSNVLRRILG